MKIIPLLTAVLAAAWISPALAHDPAVAQDAAQLKRGQMLFLQCRICHNIKAGEPNKLGPNLSGIIGKKSGLRPGFAYSPAMKASALRWDTATLDRFLTSPAKLLPGNRMAFGGIAKPADRAAVIAFIGVASK